MIIVRISGGLGNQMFQYAFGRALAERNQAELLLDLSGLAAKENEEQRHFSLGIFEAKCKIATKEDFRKLGITDPEDQTLCGRAKRYLERAGESFLPLQKRKAIIEHDFLFDADVASMGDNHYFSGIWQSEKYFSAIKNELKNDFVLKEKNTDATVDAKKMSADKSLVCLNVRRTDYVTNEKIAGKIGFIGKKYYENAVALMRKKVPDAKFLVFSDDIEWCKKNLDFIPNVFFVSHAGDENAFAKDFHMMSLCSHFIVANSTFSWWAAWLSKNENKTIIAPKKWFASGLSDRDLVPKNWIRV